jgi:hypothetical protein
MRTIAVEERRARLARRHRLAPGARTDDAVEVASRIPGARYGGVEVRPIMEFGQP